MDDIKMNFGEFKEFCNKKIFLVTDGSGCSITRLICSKETCPEVIKNKDENKFLQIKISQNKINIKKIVDPFKYNNIFKVGDCGEITENFIQGNSANFFKGEKFTVIYTNYKNLKFKIDSGFIVGAKFERKDYFFHNCNGLCENGYGRYFYREDLKYLRKI